MSTKTLYILFAIAWPVTLFLALIVGALLARPKYISAPTRRQYVSYK